MLRQRVFTALVLVAIVLACIAVPNPWPMLLLLSVMVGCAYWEWLRLVKIGRVAALGLALLLFLILAYCNAQLLAADYLSQANTHILAILGKYGLCISILFWLLLAPNIIRSASLPKFLNKYALTGLGAILLFATWYALAWIFIAFGAIALISLWALVWCADIAAYFAGKQFGQHKLAPKVSPGKTWEGAAGGVIAALLWMCVTAIYLPSSFASLILVKAGWSVVILISLLLATWSIIGDLFESILKRRAQVKDSSNLLPGHGGVYDRIDAVLPVAPMAIILFII